MHSNNFTDYRRSDKIVRYKPPVEGAAQVLDDAPSEFANMCGMLGMLFSMFGLMMRQKWCAWIAIYCTCISFVNSRVSDDSKQMISTFMLALSAVVMSYMQNPQPMTPPWSS